MSVPHVNSADISNQVLEIFRKNSNTRSGRIDTLDQISDLAKGIIGNLNDIDDSVYEITDELDNCNEEFERLMQEIDKANSEVESYTITDNALNSEIVTLEQKEEDGTITEEEKERLNSLRVQQYQNQKKSNSATGNLNKLTKSSDAISSKISGFSEELDDVTSAMEEYKNAGTIIKESANKYGKKNMNCEKVMERNESSWWGNAAKYGGMVAIGGVAVATGGAFAGIAIGSAVSTSFLGLGEALIGAAIGTGAGTVIGLGSGIGLSSLFGQGRQMQKYLDRAGYTEIGNNSQVFYDDVNHDYIAEYDALEKKGGNQIQGKMRKATAKTFSYGKTIEVASQNVEQVAEQAKLKIKKNDDAA